jgi:hypothetical protein
MAKHMHKINLLPGKENTVLIEFLNWALSIGRLLIILVETLALGTFLYRFTIDYQIVDLKDDVQRQRAFVSSYKSHEEIYRNFNARLELLKKLDAQSGNNPKILQDIIEMGKGYVTFQSIHLSSTEIQVEAKASTLPPLTAFVNSLKAYPKVTSVSIDKVENKTSSAEFLVGASASLQGESDAVDLPEFQSDPFGEPSQSTGENEASP